jgi:glucosamine--fructose-6-phosphate aminotransferase (isomerizing)
MSKYSLIENSPYFADIQGQPGALEALIKAGVPPEIHPLLDSMASFDRIILTGMGSSLNALYPTYLHLSEAGFPVWHEDTAELLLNVHGRIQGKTLFWIASQSGESAETVQLLTELATNPGDITILGFTNYPGSSLGRGSDFLFNILCGPENTVSTKSYLNTLLAVGMTTSLVLKEDLDPAIALLPEILQQYLANWVATYELLDSAVREETLFVIGRGHSLAAARTGSLITKEAARESLEGLSTSQFRHGPLEMASEKVAVFILEGDDNQRDFNSKMFEDLKKFNANPVWIHSEITPLHAGVQGPRLTSQLTRPISEMVVLQILTLVMANRKGDEPGKFRQIGKITTIL